MSDKGFRNCIKNSKGQLVLYDVIFAFAIFMLLFGGFYTYYINNLQTFESEIKINEMRSLADMSFSTLLGSKGIPDDWYASDVNVIGIVSVPKVIDAQKFSKLQSMDYATIKQKLLFGKYDFLLEFQNPYETIAIGLQPKDTNYIRVVLTAVVLKSGVTTNVKFTAYE